MKMPWNGKTGLSKALAFFATLTLVSLGLCGMNFVAVIRFVPLSGPALPPGTPTWPTTLLTATGWLEIAGIVMGLSGLLIAGIASIGKRTDELVMIAKSIKSGNADSLRERQKEDKGK